MPDSAYHKAEAERLVACANDVTINPDDYSGFVTEDYRMQYAQHLASVAQVHATLARIPEEPAATAEAIPAVSLSAEWLTLRWPPGEALVETVARALCKELGHSSQPGEPPCSRSVRYARAVLAAIGGES